MAEFEIDRALRDEHLLGAALGDAASWAIWLAILRAAFGLPLDEKQRQLFASVSGDRVPPTKRVRELWAIAGRRSGKSRMAAALSVFFALFVKHKLARGERGLVLTLAASLEQSKVVFGYVEGFLDSSETLCNEILERTKSEIRLKNGVIIACHSNSFRTVRGRTLIAAIFDEVSFWRDETTATPDSETYTAILPSLMTTNGMLVAIGSPYRRAGLQHAKHRQYFGTNSDDTLVVKGSSKLFHPLLDDEAIAAQRAADPAAAQSEWDAEFRDDLIGFLDEALIERAVERDRPLELPPQPGKFFYSAFADPSGGAIGGDFYTFCITHKEGERFVVDLVRGRRGPFDPAELTAEYAAIAKEFRIGTVIGDKYAASWVTAAWQKHHISYINSDLPASQLYLESLPLFTRGLVSMPDHPTLLRELRLLERTPSRMGKDQVSHPRGVNDDHANALCGGLRTISNHLGYNPLYPGWCDDDDDKQARDERYRSELMGHILNSVRRGW